MRLSPHHAVQFPVDLVHARRSKTLLMLCVTLYIEHYNAQYTAQYAMVTQYICRVYFAHTLYTVHYSVQCVVKYSALCNISHSILHSALP